MKTLITDWLNSEGAEACSEARQWLQSLPEDATMAEAWALCARPDWLLWALNAAGMLHDYSTLRKLACVFVSRTPLADGRTIWDAAWDAAWAAQCAIIREYINCPWGDEGVAE